MAGVALNNSTFNQSVAAGHVTYERWEFTGSYTPTYPIDYDGDGIPDGWGGGDPIYDWIPHATDARINGVCIASPSNVYVNGFNPVLQGDATNEIDSYDPPSGTVRNIVAHSGANGSVSAGNNRNVYISGKLVAVNGSNVTTHAGTTTTVNQGSSNVFIGG